MKRLMIQHRSALLPAALAMLCLGTMGTSARAQHAGDGHAAVFYEWRNRYDDPERVYLYYRGRQVGGFCYTQRVYRPYDVFHDVWGPPMPPPIAIPGANHGIDMLSAHLDRLALQMQRQAEVMHREVHAHFRNTPQFTHLDADVAKLERVARHIHDLAHHHGNLSHIRRDVEEIDHLYHHVQELVNAVSLSGQVGYDEIRHLRLAIAQLGEIIHHTRDDLQPRYHDHDHGLGH